MNEGFLSCLCSIGSLGAIITVYVGLFTDRMKVVNAGVIVAALNLILCTVFFVLYFSGFWNQ